MSDSEEVFRVTLSAGEPSEIRIAAEGELDSASAQQLAAAYAQALERSELKSATVSQERQPFRIILDLGGVDFIDSAGLRMLIVIQGEAENLNVPLTVLAPPDSVTQLLHLSGIAERVNLVAQAPERPPDPDFLEQVELELDADATAPRRARAAVRESLGPILSDSALASAVLMTSELVTNGVVHPPGASTLGLRLTRFADAVQVEVDDAGLGFDPSAASSLSQQAPSLQKGGRGLFVVDLCADRWGTRQSETDRGTRFSVWFELETGDA